MVCALSLYILFPLCVAMVFGPFHMSDQHKKGLVTTIATSTTSTTIATSTLLLVNLYISVIKTCIRTSLYIHIFHDSYMKNPKRL